MTTIVTRSGKGSPLTHTEVDANFTNLNTNKLEAGAIALGSAATPSISFTGDTNTGIFSPGADQVAVATNGTQKLIILSDGKTGIGASSPIFLTDILSGTPNTGANVNNPSQLSVTGPNKTLIGGGATFFVNSNSDFAIDTGGSIALSGRNTTSSTNSVVWGVVKGAKENATSTNTAGYLAFASQNHNTGALVEAMRIDSQQRVAIGTTAPAEKLHIVAAAPYIQVEATSGATGSAYYGFNNSTGGADIASTSHIRFAVPGLEAARIDSSGRLLVGTSTVLTSSFVSIQFNGSVDNGITLKTTYASNGSNYLAFTGSGGALAGYIQQTGSTTVSYVTTSDYRLKENVSLIGDSITRLQQLKPRRFNFISEPDRIVDGFLAHEAQAVVPECVTGEKDEVDDDGTPVYQGIDQSKLVPLLTAALQEAIAKIEVLEARLTAAGID